MIYTTQIHQGLSIAVAACLSVAVVGHSHGASGPGSVLAGPAHVVDGDTLDIGNERIRLEGIDAPEHGQRCRRSWLPVQWQCGQAATRLLRKITAGKTVTCQSYGRDKYQRTLGVCFVDGVDINRVMVERGLAWAFVKYSQRYVASERLAREKHAGIWQAKTKTAWEFRANKWTASQQTAPEDCPIKGNITDNGRIYHMPWSPWYSRVRIDERRGEQWFCSESDAIAAGWRPVAAS